MPASDLIRCTLHAPDASTRIEVLDGEFRPLDLIYNLGTTTIHLKQGVYIARFHKDGTFVEKPFAALPEMGDMTVELAEADQNKLTFFRSAAPIDGTSTTHEWQRNPAIALSHSSPISISKGGSFLMLFMRDTRSEIRQAPDVRISLHKLNGRMVFDLLRHGQKDSQAQWIGAHLELPPDGYLMRYGPSSGGFFEQAIFTSAGWQTQVFLLSENGGGGDSEIVKVSVLMSPKSEGFDPTRRDALWAESALMALERRSDIPGRIEDEMLFGKFQNPMLGLYAGLLHLRRPEIDASMIQTVIRNLLRFIGPVPDVAALACALFNRDEATIDPDLTFLLRPLRTTVSPPMLLESWHHLRDSWRLEGFRTKSERSLERRISKRIVSNGPWFMWERSVPANRPVANREIRHFGLDEAGIEGPVFAVKASVKPEVARERTAERKLRWSPDMDNSLFHPRTSDELIRLFADRLDSKPELLPILQSNRFSDLERGVSYWLCPVLDPRVRAWTQRDQYVAESLRRKGIEHRESGIRGITEALDLDILDAEKIIYRLIDKLFILPHLPSRTALRKFTRQVTQRFPERLDVLRSAGDLILPLQHPDTGRFLSALELLYLAYNVQGAFDVLARYLKDLGFTIENSDKAAPQETLQQIISECLKFISKESPTLAPAATHYLSELVPQSDGGEQNGREGNSSNRGQQDSAHDY